MTAPIRPNQLRTVPGGMRWNPTLRRYIAANGRILSGAQVRSAIDATLLSYQTAARDLAAQLRGGNISLAAWEVEMRSLVKDANLLGSASASGGWVQLHENDAALGRAGAQIKKQYRFLNRFALDVASGKQKLDGTLANRSVMYVEAARDTYEVEREAQDRAAGFDEERSIRHVSDSCDGCIREAGRGWVPIGMLVRIGHRDCLTHCRCTLERRRSTDAPRPRNAPRRPQIRRTRVPAGV